MARTHAKKTRYGATNLIENANEALAYTFARDSQYFP